MKYPIFFTASLLFFCILFQYEECTSVEYFTIGTADSIAKQSSDLYASSHVFYLQSPKGDIIKYGDKLPDGYSWLPEKRLQLPGGVVLEKNGFLTLPNNLYPEQYDIKSDGSIIAPRGVVLKPVNPENKDNSQKQSEKAKSEEKELSIEELLDFDRIFAEEKAAEEAKRKGKKETPATKKDKKPVSVAEKEKKKEEPAPKPKKKGDKFEIPEKAYEDKNLAFLEGCWRAKGGKTCTGNSELEDPDSYSRFCFDKSGRGQRTIHEKRGDYKGPATASIKGNKMYISSGKLYNTSRFLFFHYYVPRQLYCEGSSIRTECKQEISCESGRTLKDHIYLKRE